MINNLGKINILIIIIIVLVQIIIIGAGYVFFIYIPSTVEEDTSLKLHTLEKTEVQHNTNPRVDLPNRTSKVGNQDNFDNSNYDIGGKDYIRDFALFTIDDLAINLTGPETYFFLVTVNFEYRQADKKLPDELNNKTPMIKDRLINYFSRLTIDEIRNIDNREIFKEDILTIINRQLLEGRITNVLFEKYVFQKM